MHGNMSPSCWSREFITRVLHITQAQWIHQNSSLHQRESGYLAQQEHKVQANDIERYLGIDSEKIPRESRHLVEVDPAELFNATVERQLYWLLTMEAARKAGNRRAGRGHRQGLGRKAEERRRVWTAKMKCQLTLVTQEVKRSLEGWGKAEQPKRSRRRSRAGESAECGKKNRHPD